MSDKVGPSKTQNSWVFAKGISSCEGATFERLDEIEEALTDSLSVFDKVGPSKNQNNWVLRKDYPVFRLKSRRSHRLSTSALGALLAAEHVPLHRIKVVLPVLSQTPDQ